jgi:hypothetical protein
MAEKTRRSTFEGSKKSNPHDSTEVDITSPIEVLKRRLAFYKKLRKVVPITGVVIFIAMLILHLTTHIPLFSRGLAYFTF